MCRTNHVLCSTCTCRQTPILFLCPCSCLQHWGDEIQRQGDTLEKNSALKRLFPSAARDRVPGYDRIDDKRQLMDLTHLISEEERHMVYHRLDRFNLDYAWQWANHNIYGLVEFFYNGLGKSDLQKQFTYGSATAFNFDPRIEKLLTKPPCSTTLYWNDWTQSISLEKAP